MVSKGAKVAKPLNDLAEVARVTYADTTVIQLETGSIQIEFGGERQTVVKPFLREICTELGIELLNNNGNKRNTRQLGAQIIATLSA